MPSERFNRAAAANIFWGMPIDKLNHLIKRKIKDDASEKTGVSLVIGCPFPADLLGKIEDLKKFIDAEMNGIGIKVIWRTKSEAFHLTVSGLILPDEFSESLWPLSSETLVGIKRLAEGMKGKEIRLGSVGILGMGAITLGIDDNPGLDLLQSELEVLPEFKMLRHGSMTKKIVIGRLNPSFIENAREFLKLTINKFKDNEIGTTVIPFCI